MYFLMLFCNRFESITANYFPYSRYFQFPEFVRFLTSASTSRSGVTPRTCKPDELLSSRFTALSVMDIGILESPNEFIEKKLRS